MAIEGLDAALPIENAGFRPQVGIPETPEANAGPTLDDALRQMAIAEGPAALGPDTLLDREAMRQAAAPDLWIEDRMGTGYRPSSTSGAGIVPGALVYSSDALSIDQNALEDNGFIVRELSLKELNLVAGALGTTDEWPDDEIPDVVVVGPSIDDNWHLWDDDPFQPEDNDGNPDGGWGGGQGGPDEPAPQDSDQHVITVQIERPLLPHELEAIAKLKDAIERITNLLDRLPADARFRMADGREVTVAELRELWRLADFRIVDNHVSFDNGSSDLPGVGSADFNNRNPIFSVTIAQLVGYMGSEASQNLYLLHELSHVTSAGLGYRDAMYDPSSAGGATRTSAEHNAHEQWANGFAWAIANAGHVPIWGDPFGGYPSVFPTYSDGTGPPVEPPVGGGGGGGGGGQVTPD